MSALDSDFPLSVFRQAFRSAFGSVLAATLAALAAGYLGHLGASGEWLPPVDILELLALPFVLGWSLANALGLVLGALVVGALLAFFWSERFRVDALFVFTALLTLFVFQARCEDSAAEPGAALRIVSILAVLVGVHGGLRVWGFVAARRRGP